MAKIQHHPHPKRPNQPVEAPSVKTTPPKTEPSAPKIPEAKDHFLREVAEAVYQNQPLVMLCTQPQLRSLASKVPIIKDIADTICPIVPGAKQALKISR